MAPDIRKIGSLWLRQEQSGVFVYDRDRDRFLFFPDADRNALSGCASEDEALAALKEPDRIASRTFKYPLRIGWMLTSRAI